MEIIKKIHKKFDDFTLNRKFTCIICFVLAMSVLGTGAGLWITYHSGNELLYEATKESLDYSSSVIAERLSNIEDMTGMILADASIQNTLSSASDPEASDNDKNEAFRTLSYIIPDYYQNFRQNGIYYINLYNPNYTTYSNLARCRNLPAQVEEDLLERAHRHSGYPVWVTDYCSEYGLFLVRDVRRAKDFELDILGTILVNVDLDEVIQNASSRVFNSAPLSYVIYQEEREIYHSPVLNEESVDLLYQSLSCNYGTMRQGKNSYFYSRGRIPEFGWDYLCLRPNGFVMQARSLSMIVSVGVVVLTFVAGLYLSRKMFQVISRHFYCLLEKMECFGRDEAAIPPAEFDYSGRTDEIGALHQGFDRMALQVQELIQKNYVSELLAKDARLKFLENQINPHFLYNTLESINSYAKSMDAEPISQMVEALGSLLRITLSRSSTESVIKSELSIVKDYMDIIKVRFGERIEYEVMVPPELYNVSIPRLTLQPLVENAINYALEEMTEVCCIRIAGQRKNGRVFLMVSNNGSQFPENLLEQLEKNEIEPHGFGIGLLNIDKRIKLQFGNEYGLYLYNEELEDLAVVQIRLPDSGGDLC